MAVPQGTAPTVAKAGQIAVDTTADQFVYYGTAKRVLPYKREKSLTLVGPTNGDVILMWKSVDPVTITAANCLVDPADSSESVAITIQVRNADADTPSTVSTITCANTNTSGTISSGAIAANYWVAVSVGTVTGTVSQLALTINYTTDAQ
jgi:hypothetical protein